MISKTVDQLLGTLDVRLHAFSTCEIGEGTRLRFEAMATPVIHYVLDGDGVLETGKTKLRFGPRSILIVPAQLQQSVVAGEMALREVQADGSFEGADGMVRYAAGDSSRAAVRMMCCTVSATYGGSFGLFDDLGDAIVEGADAEPAFDAAFTLLAAERDRSDLGTHAIAEALMKVVLVLVVRRRLRESDPTSPFAARFVDPRLANAVSTVLREPGAPMNLASLARTAGMSRSAFSKAFSEAFRQSPMDFVQQTRLHNGARLLSGTDLPIQVIASSLGYGSRTHFSRAFRRRYGMDPTRYRAGREVVA